MLICLRDCHISRMPARSNDLFCKYKTQKTEAPKDHLPPPEAVVQRTGFSVSSSSGGTDDSPLGPARVDGTDRKFLPPGPAPADQTYKTIFDMDLACSFELIRRTCQRYFPIIVPLLPVNLILSDRNPQEEIYFLFFSGVFVGLLIFIVKKPRQ